MCSSLMAANVTTAAAATVVAPQSPSPATITTTTRLDKLSVRVSPSISTANNSKSSTSINTTTATATEEEIPSSNTTSETIATSSNTNRVTIKLPQQSKDSVSSTTRVSIAGASVIDSGDKFAANSKAFLAEKVSIGVQELPLQKISSAQFGLPSIPQKRKFSFPASLHANLLGLSSANNESFATTNASTRRRFSNVGDVVSRKLSNTIGWRTLPVPPQEVVAQGKALCCQYIRNRLKRSGIFNKKLGLYRLRSVVGTPSGMIVTEVYPSLVTAGQELERMHPKVFTNIARQASSTPAGVIVSDKAAATLLLAIGREIIKTDITWGKVVAVFAVAGGLAVDCVCQGHPEYLHGLVEGVADLLEEELAEWIASNGGWTSLSAQCRTPTPEITTSAYLSIFGIFIAIVFLFYIVFKFCCRLYLL